MVACIGVEERGLCYSVRVLAFSTPAYSSLCYNTYHKAWLLSSDYDGTVCVWDTSTRLVKFQVRKGGRWAIFYEHGKRVWSVVYDPTDPNLFVSLGQMIAQVIAL